MDENTTNMIRDGAEKGMPAINQLRKQMNDLVNAFFRTSDIRGIDPKVQCAFVNTVLGEYYVRTSQLLWWNYSGDMPPADSKLFKDAVLESFGNSFDSIVNTILKAEIRGENV